MNNNFGNGFGKHVNNGGGSGVRAKVLFVFAVILALVLIYLTKDAWGNAGPMAPMLLGMLGNPFQTTRKMKVPPHSRVGHRERAFIKFMKFVYWLCLGLLALVVIVRAISALGG